MIDAALSHIASQLDGHLRRMLALPGPWVAVSPPEGQPGPGPTAPPAPLLLFLAGVQPDAPAGAAWRAEVGFPKPGTSRPRRWTLQVVCAVGAGGPAYPEALKLLSLVVQFLQDHPTASRSTASALGPPLDQLTVLVENLTPADQHHLWAIHNQGRHLPSVVCRVEVVGSFDEGGPPAVNP